MTRKREKATKLASTILRTMILNQKKERSAKRRTRRKISEDS
jgi:hypothetical protein